MDATVEHDELSQEYLAAPWGAWGRTATLSLVSLVSKFIINVMNTSHFNNTEVLMEAIEQRPKEVGLITVSNHTSTLDDPMLFSAMLPWSFFLTEHHHKGNRWTLCAREMCYRNAFLSQFFKSGKTLPVERGAGLDQPVMQVVASAVAAGDWVHMFPEGKINYTGHLAPLRWGVGKLFCDAYMHSGHVPIVLPFYHSGMGDVMPKKARIPRPGNTVTVTFGRPIDLEALASQCASETKEGRECAWKEITQRIDTALRALEAEMPPNKDQTRRSRTM